MPVPPKNPPKWLPQFVEYGIEKEKKVSVKEALAVFAQVVERRWAKFHETMKESAPAPKRRQTDPMKSLDNALKKATAQIDPSNPDSALQFRDHILGAMPPAAQAMFLLPNAGDAVSDTGIDGSGNNNGKLSNSAVQQATHQIDELMQHAEQARQALQCDIAQTGGTVVSQNMISLVNEVCGGLQYIRQILDSPDAQPANSVIVAPTIDSLPNVIVGSPVSMDVDQPPN